MSFTLTFHSLDEKIPAHGQKILYFDYLNEVKHGVVFYTWEDENGNFWPYSEFVYDTNPEEEINLHFNIDECMFSPSFTWYLGRISEIKDNFNDRIYWTDYNQAIDSIR